MKISNNPQHQKIEKALSYKSLRAVEHLLADYRMGHRVQKTYFSSLRFKIQIANGI